MQATFAVAKIEFLLLFRDKRFLLIGIAFWVMLGGLLAFSQSHFLSEQLQLRKAQLVSRQQWQSRNDSSGHALGHYGTYVYRGATPLSLLNPGSEPYVGVAAHIMAHQQTNLFYRPILDRPVIDRWADASAGTLLQVVVPLLLLLLAFASIAGDREDGRFHFLLSQGASPLAFGVGKLLGVGAAAASLLLPAVLVVVLLISNAANALGGGSDLAARLALLCAGFGALYLFFLAAGVAISALSPTRQSALLLCVGFWAVLCLVVPKVLATAAENRFPTPEADVLKEKIDAERKDRRAGELVRVRVTQDALRRYKVQSAKELPIDLDPLLLQAGEEWVNGINDKHMGEVWSLFAAQENWVGSRGAFLTPSVSLRNLSETVAGTDAITLRQHVKAIEDYRRDWMRRLNEADARRPRRRGAGKSGKARQAQSASEHEKEHQTQQAVWASFPPFLHQPPALPALRPRTSHSLLVLWSWAGLAVLAALTIVRIKSGAKRGSL